MSKSKYIVVPQVGVRRLRYQEIGHTCGGGDLMWWIRSNGLIQWQVFDGLNHHHDVSAIDMDARWRGRLDKAGNCTLLPPVKIYSLNADKILTKLPSGAMITLTHLGAKRFYLDSPKGLLRLKKSRVDRRKKV